MSSLKGLASIARGLSARPPADLVEELAAVSTPDPQPSTEAFPTSVRPLPKPLAKTRDEDYKRVMVLIRRTTEKAAYRRWEDTHPEKDFSDLVEMLLNRYADGQISA